MRNAWLQAFCFCLYVHYCSTAPAISDTERDFISEAESRVPETTSPDTVIMEMCAAPDMPENFEVKEDALNIGTRGFSVIGKRPKLGDKDFGRVEETFFSWTTELTWTIGGKKVAVANNEMLSWGSTINVKDCEGNDLGKIKEQLFDIEGQYTLQTPSKKVAATSDKVNWG